MKNKFFIAMAALVATVGTVVLPSCSQQPTTIEFDIPTYEDNKDINIGVWNGSHHDLSDMELDNLRKAGVNLLVGDYVRKTPLIDFIDRCAEFGLDQTLEAHAVQETKAHGMKKSLTSALTQDKKSISHCVTSTVKTNSISMSMTSLWKAQQETAEH